MAGDVSETIGGGAVGGGTVRGKPVGGATIGGAVAGLSPPLRWAAAVTAATWLVGTLVLSVGWGLGVERVRRVAADSALMAPSTALCFVLIGTALIAWIVSAGPTRTVTRTVSRLVVAVASFVAAVATVDLYVSSSGTAQGIDELLVPSVEMLHSASMAPATAFGFLLTALCLALLVRDRPAADRGLVISATSGLLLALVVLVGYAFDTAALYALSIFATMALQTALCFVGVFAATLLTRAERGWIGILRGSHGGSAGARRLFPLVVAAPLSLCLITLSTSRSTYLQTELALAILAVAIMVLLASAVLRNAVLENRAEGRLLELGDELRAAVAERDLLLSEVHHRVRNNLQQINGLLQIEARRLADPTAREAFRASAARVHSMSVVHELLLASGDAASMRTSLFLQSLCDNLVPRRRAAGPNVAIDVEADDLSMPMDTAIALGLLVHECTTNALKHAFRGRREGRIDVRFHRLAAGGAELVVADDGIGLPPAPADPSGTGTLIIGGFVGQLGATMTTDVADGTRIEIRIPAEALAGRARA